MTTMRRANPREQGEIGLSIAISWFGRSGYAVLVPLCDNQPYDLIVDDGERLARVEVKTTTRRTRGGVFYVDLRTTGGNRSVYTSRLFDPAKADLLFVVTDAGDANLLPTTALTTTSNLTLGPRVQSFRVGGPVAADGAAPYHPVPRWDAREAKGKRL